nr:MAG TPA: envelope glycoprotein [Caudoviricetes sp.]
MDHMKLGLLCLLLLCLEVHIFDRIVLNGIVYV